MKAIDELAGRRDAESEYPPLSNGTESYLDGYCYRVVEIHDQIHKARLNEGLSNERHHTHTKAV